MQNETQRLIQSHFKDFDFFFDFVLVILSWEFIHRDICSLFFILFPSICHSTSTHKFFFFWIKLCECIKEKRGEKSGLDIHHFSFGLNIQDSSLFRENQACFFSSRSILILNWTFDYKLITQKLVENSMFYFVIKMK